MFDFLFKKYIEKINRLNAEIYELRNRVKDLENQYYDLNRSVDQDKKIDRHLHEINSEEIKNLRSDVDELKKVKKTVKKTIKAKTLKKTKENADE